MINHNNYIPGAIFSGNGISSNFISENPDHNNGLGCWEPHRTLLQPEDCAPGVRDGYQPQPGGAFCTDSGFAGVGLDCPTGSQHAEGPWSTEELMRLLDALLQNGRKWQAVARAVRTRSCSQVRQKGLGIMSKLVKQYELGSVVRSITSRSTNDIHPTLFQILEEQLKAVANGVVPTVLATPTQSGSSPDTPVRYMSPPISEISNESPMMPDDFGSFPGGRFLFDTAHQLPTPWNPRKRMSCSPQYIDPIRTGGKRRMRMIEETSKTEEVYAQPNNTALPFQKKEDAPIDTDNRQWDDFESRAMNAQPIPSSELAPQRWPACTPVGRAVGYHLSRTSAAAADLRD
eukprot:GHVO01009300.1.p1 GENE.GHVO01009300.1~~GHVO01009300.1.p1  ORF type:complete len:345 (-),score=34.77 GHVO01009300.1:1025-2059(-)